MLCTILHGDVKATAAIRMARRPSLINQQQQAIAVTIYAKLNQLLDMPRGFAFHPHRATLAGPIGYPPCLKRELYRLGIHPSHHQHFVAIGILRNRWNQAIFVKCKFLNVKFHSYKPLLLRCFALCIVLREKGKDYAGRPRSDKIIL